MKIITCNNPDCQQEIQVPPGALQVICYACNTWHPLDHQFPVTPAQIDPIVPPPSPSVPEAPQQLGVPDYALPGHYSTASIPAQSTPEAQQVNVQPIGFLLSEDGRRFQLRSGVNTVGRKSADVLLEDKTVSREHCIIEVIPHTDGSWNYFVYDVSFTGKKESANGVFVSGRTMRLQSHEKISLMEGSQLTIGQIEIVLQIHPS